MKTKLIFCGLFLFFFYASLIAQDVKVIPSNTNPTTNVPAANVPVANVSAANVPTNVPAINVPTSNVPATNVPTTNVPLTTTTTTTTTSPTTVTTTTVVTTSLPSAVASATNVPASVSHTADSTAAIIQAKVPTETITQLNSTQKHDSIKAKKPHFWVGLKFGLDISSTTNNFSKLSDQLKGNYQAGISFQFGRILYFQPEIYYANYKIDDTTSMDYIKVPLMFGLKFLDLGLFSLNIMTGPSCNLLLDKKDGYDETSSFTWLVGVRVDILGFITTDLRYTLNNKSISEQVKDATTNPTTLNLTVGLRFR
jgi:hypothetical protein